MPAPLNLFGLRGGLVDSLVPFKYSYEKESDSESESSSDQEDDTFGVEDLEIDEFAHLKGSPFIYFSSSFIEKDHVLAIYKRWFTQEQLESEPLGALKNLSNKRQSAVILIGGGHFSAAIIEHKPKSLVPDKLNPYANIVIKFSKSFHRYTVRRKQGGAQSTSDNASGKANSAGSSIRRQNEMMLRQEVQDLLVAWSDELAQCQTIFYHASGRTNKGIIIGYPKSPLVSDDQRLRQIPLSTKRATADEVKRVWKELTTVRIVETPDNQELIKQKEQARAKELREKELRDKATQAKEQAEKETIAKAANANPEEVRTEAITQAIKKSSLSQLKQLLENNVDVALEPVAAFKGTPTALFYAARNGKHQVVANLLRWGANPTIRPTGKTLGQVAASHKKVQGILQATRKEIPEAWDWDSAGVGEPLSLEEQAANEELEQQRLAKEQIQQLQKQEKQLKERKIEKLINKHGPGRSVGGQMAGVVLSEEDKRHIEREKRARAAEARLARMNQ